MLFNVAVMLDSAVLCRVVVRLLIYRWVYAV